MCFPSPLRTHGWDTDFLSGLKFSSFTLKSEHLLVTNPLVDVPKRKAVPQEVGYFNASVYVLNRLPCISCSLACFFGIAKKYLQRLPGTNDEGEQGEELDHDPSQGGL